MRQKRNRFLNRLLRRYSDGQKYATALALAGAVDTDRQKRKWHSGDGAAWRAWERLTADEKRRALKRAGPRPLPTAELAAEASVA